MTYPVMISTVWVRGQENYSIDYTSAWVRMMVDVGFPDCTCPPLLILTDRPKEVDAHLIERGCNCADIIDIGPSLRDKSAAGWWAKLELFRHRNLRLVNTDIDIVVLRDLNPLLARSIDAELVMIRDWIGYGGEFSSNILSVDTRTAFAQTVTELWDKMPAQVMTTPGGDQAFINQTLAQTDGKVKPVAIPDGWCGSWRWRRDAEEYSKIKPHIKADTGSLEDSYIMCFHGHPKPHQVVDTHPLVHKLWVP